MLKITASATTDVGLQRDHNEDAWAVDEEHGLYIVCDGMGGHASGEVASKLCAEQAIEFWKQNEKTPTDDLPYKVDDAAGREESLLSNAIQFANDRVYIEGMKDAKLEGMGTTITALKACEDRVVLAHVGDSRVYRWSADGCLEQVTRDHSLLNYKIDRGDLKTEEEIKNFKQGNIIVRAIGLKDTVDPELNVVPRRPGDIFLLCSDGLTDLVDDWSIENVLEVNYDELDEAGQCFVRMANNAGGKDNITVMLVRIDDVPPVQPVASPDPDICDEPTDEVEAIEEDTEPRGVAVEGLDDDEEPDEDTQPNMQAFNPDDLIDDESDWVETEEPITEDEIAGLKTDPGINPFKPGQGFRGNRAPTMPSMPSFKIEDGFVGESGATKPGMPAFEKDPRLAATEDATPPFRPEDLAAVARPADGASGVIVGDVGPVAAAPRVRERGAGRSEAALSERERRVPTAKIQTLQAPESLKPRVRKPEPKKRDDDLPSIIIDDNQLE